MKSITEKRYRAITKAWGLSPTNVRTIHQDAAGQLVNVPTPDGKDGQELYIALRLIAAAHGYDEDLLDED